MVNSIVQVPHFVYHNLYIKQQTCENLGSIGHWSREKITGKATLVSASFAMSWHVFKKNKSVILAIENWYCFNVFSKSKAFHGTIFQEKSFTITFCKPCKLFVNLWIFSVPKVYNGFKLKAKKYPQNIQHQTCSEIINPCQLQQLLWWPVIMRCSNDFLQRSFLCKKTNKKKVCECVPFWNYIKCMQTAFDYTCECKNLGHIIPNNNIMKNGIIKTILTNEGKMTALFHYVMK